MIVVKGKRVRKNGVIGERKEQVERRRVRGERSRVGWDGGGWESKMRWKVEGERSMKAERQSVRQKDVYGITGGFKKGIGT